MKRIILLITILVGLIGCSRYTFPDDVYYSSPINRNGRWNGLPNYHYNQPYPGWNNSWYWNRQPVIVVPIQPQRPNYSDGPRKIYQPKQTNPKQAPGDNRAPIRKFGNYN